MADKASSTSQGQSQNQPTAAAAGSNVNVSNLSNGTSKKLTAINVANRPGGKIKLKGGAGGGGGAMRILLPSRVGVPQQQQQPAGPGPAQQHDNNGAVDDGRPKPWKSSGMGPPPVPPPPSANSRQSVLDAQYGNYLQSFLEAALMEEISNLQRLGQVDGMASKCIIIATTECQINKNAANFRTTELISGLSHLEGIRSAFNSVLELTGVEMLVEIQNVLSSKHDRLLLEGASVEGPLFQDNELEEMLELLRNRKCKADGESNNNKTVLGWCSQFVEKLEEITLNKENVERDSALLEEATRLLLEQCSMAASEHALKCEGLLGEQLTVTVPDNNEEQEQVPSVAPSVPVG